MDFHLLAEQFLNAASYRKNEGVGLRYWNGGWYEYRKRSYRPLSLCDLTNKVNTWFAAEMGLKEKVGGAWVKRLIEAVKIYSKVPDHLQWPMWDLGPEADPDDDGFKQISGCIAFKNGVLNINDYLKARAQSWEKEQSSSNPEISKDILLPHSENFLSFNVLPYDFDPQAKCPVYDTMVREILPDEDTVTMWHEWCGNHFNTLSPIGKFFILLGEGANGKSVLLNLLTELLGQDNVSHISLASFDENSFALSETFGKLANICAEMNDLDKISETAIKRFVTEDPITVNRKYQTHFKFVPKAKLTFATNVLPTFQDKTNGIWRRIVLVELKNQFSEDVQRGEFLKGSFWHSNGELSGICNHALDGLFNLLRRGKLLQSQLTREATEQYRMDSNPIAQFLSSKLELSPGDFITMETAFEAYVQWCQANGYRTMNQTNFMKNFWSAAQLLQYKIEQDRIRMNGPKKRIARGVKLKLH